MISQIFWLVKKNLVYTTKFLSILSSIIGLRNWFFEIWSNLSLTYINKVLASVFSAYFSFIVNTKTVIISIADLFFELLFAPGVVYSKLYSTEQVVLLLLFL